ncbi:MAG: DNA primase, partial [Bacteroidota bacterium]
SLYVKECARLFGVEEQLLVAEINKAISTKLRKHQQKQAAQAAPGASSDGSFPSAPPPGWEGMGVDGQPPPTDGAMPPPATPSAIGDEYQERDLVRLLMLFGDQEFDQKEQQSVGGFIIANIDDVIDNFDNELYKRIAKECQILIARGDNLRQQHFLHHDTPEMRQLAANLLSSPYAYSDNWEKRWDVILNQKHPDQNFIKDSAHGLKRFRLRKLSRLCEENIAKIKELAIGGQDEELVLYMQLQQKLQGLRNELAGELGTVVL